MIPTLKTLTAGPAPNTHPTVAETANGRGEILRITSITTQVIRP